MNASGQAPFPASTKDHGGSHPIVLSVGFPFATVGPEAVGGAEVVLSEIEKALPSLGFRSVVVAREGSAPLGRLYATPAVAGEIDEAARARVEAAQQANIDQALREHPVSLVHLHGLDFHRYRFPADLPIVVTIHLPPGWYPKSVWTLPPNYHLICVSETQKADCPEGARDRIEVIGNGVTLPDRASLRPEGKYALMLSRICPEKNLHTGFAAARLAGIPAILAGEVFPYRDHLRYFAEEIEPCLTVTQLQHTARRHHAGADARFLGPVTGAAKARLLSRAACLLLPSLAPETSSLVAMEALAAGVPVVAVASGAVPEIVENGRTGFLVPSKGDTVANLASALKKVPSLDRELCRETAEAHFSVETMLQAYATLYRQLAQQVPQRTTEQTKAPAKGVCTSKEEQAESCKDVRTTLLVGTDALERVEEDWVELWQSDPTATPFQHPAWLLPWAHQFGPDGSVQAIELRNERGRLAGLLPLFGYGEPSGTTQKLLLLGTGTTDYLGGLFRPPFALSLAAQALKFTAERTTTWNQLYFGQLRQDSPLLQVSGLGPNLHVASAEPCAILPTAPALPTRVSANIRRYRRRAEARGQLQFALAVGHSEAEQFFRELVGLHTTRWQARMEAGVLNDERVLRHHHQALPALLKADLLRIFRLCSNEKTISVLYALADPVSRPVRRLYLYLIGIDVDVSEISPGSLILHCVWDYARRHGFVELDLLRGGERYKELWGAIPSPTRALHTTR